MPERSSHTWHGAGTCSCPAVPCELPAYRAPAPDATQLNADITAAEVESALRWAKRGKAAGHDGLSADLLKDAAPVLLEESVHLFNLMLAGDNPDARSMGLIMAVHKGGDMNNYRCITITPPLKNVFDSVLECRLTAWTEGHGLRAATQAGFRPDQRTGDQHYVLHTLLDKYCRGGGQLLCCFEDFRKALTLCREMCCGQCLVALVLGAASCTAYRPGTTKTVQQP